MNGWLGEATGGGLGPPRNSQMQAGGQVGFSQQCIWEYLGGVSYYKCYAEGHNLAGFPCLTHPWLSVKALHTDIRSSGGKSLLGMTLLPPSGHREETVRA